MAVRVQTDGYVVIGVLPNDEHYRCLVCGCVPDRVHQDLFVPEPGEVPASIASRADKRQVVVLYRLCPHCYKAKPRPWKIRLLMLEKINAMTEGL